MSIVFITLWFSSFLFAYKKNNDLIYNPIAWLLLGFGFCFGVYFTAGIDYTYKLSFAAGTYYWLVVIMTALGFKLSKKVKFTINSDAPKKRFAKVNEISKSTYLIYVVFVVVGAALYVFDVFRLNGMRRNLHSGLVLSAIGNIGILLTGLGLLLWLYDTVNAIKHNRKISFFAYVSLVCYIIPSVITSGRQNLLIASVASVVVLFYSFSINKKYRYKMSLFLPIAIALVLMLIYVTVISVSRTEVDNKIELFDYMYRSNMSKETENLLNSLGALKPFYMEILYYYSHELSMFESFFRLYDGPKFWGLAQFSLLARNIPAGNDLMVADVINSAIKEYSDNAGLYNHVWRSAAGSVMLDFGIVGGQIFSFITGYVTGRFYIKCKRELITYNVVGLSLVCSGMLFAMQYSPIGEGYWLYPFFWWLVLPIVEWVFNKNTAVEMKRAVPVSENSGLNNGGA